VTRTAEMKALIIDVIDRMQESKRQRLTCLSERLNALWTLPKFRNLFEYAGNKGLLSDFPIRLSVGKKTLIE
jgi:hypothetical protein